MCVHQSNVIASCTDKTRSDTFIQVRAVFVLLAKSGNKENIGD